MGLVEGCKAFNLTPSAKNGLDFHKVVGENLANLEEKCTPTISRGNGGVDRLAEIRLQEGESLESALRRFKRKVQQEDIIKETKKHSFYLKPGERKRVKAALARKRARKKARHDQD
jgi:small subunit ribosomal protein S21